MLVGIGNAAHRAGSGSGEAATLAGPALGADTARSACGDELLLLRHLAARPGLAERAFKNTFAPGVGGDVIGVGMVIAGLRHGTIKEASLPREVHEAVAAELARIRRRAISGGRALILLLGAMGEVKGRTRLQKYAFLVDMNLYSKKTKDLFTMYGWEPGKFGPHSRSLERHVHRAVRDSLVETFPVHDPNGKESAGYRLTSAGRGAFQELQGAFQRDVLAIKDILERFKDDHSVDPLLAHVYGAYPEYADKSTIRKRAENATQQS